MDQPSEETVLLQNVAATFGHPSGQAVLTYLAQRCWYDETLYQPGMPALDMAYREGQRAVFVQLLQLVNDALTTTAVVPHDSYEEQLQLGETYSA